MGAMPTNPPQSMQHHSRQRLNKHARSRWPQLAGGDVRFHTEFAYVARTLSDGQALPLSRPRFGGVLHT